MYVTSGKIKSYFVHLANRSLIGQITTRLTFRLVKVSLYFSNDSQRKQFGDLFALMEEEEEISATKSSRLQGRGRKPASSSKPPVATVSSTKRQIVRDMTDSSDDSSEVGINYHRYQ